ncbi:hypothetical protein ZZ1p0004 [Acinetobacter phage ZZ1]|uniref:Uncharacterized protein n=1 Tax=Acinetobacter phage ZZ1 TaxID=1049283 RepID=I3WVW8_9CAUD|nr:hypothetical protein ZZ1p0004 [Acinetobacter phage ZZ1]AFL47638.1 hypothetical protein ZZ1p0004 [Acinetobacter phage ZZ1]
MATLTKKVERFQIKMTNIILSDVSFTLNKMEGKIGEIDWKVFNKKGMSTFVINVTSKEEYDTMIAFWNVNYIRKGEGLYECKSIIGEQFIMEVSKFENGKATVTLLAM